MFLHHAADCATIVKRLLLSRLQSRNLSMYMILDINENNRKPSNDGLRLFHLFRTGSAPGGSFRFPIRWSPLPRCFSFRFCCRQVKRRCFSSSRCSRERVCFSSFCASRCSCSACCDRVPTVLAAVCFRIWRCIRFGFAASGRMAAATDGLNRRRLWFFST